MRILILILLMPLLSFAQRDSSIYVAGPLGVNGPVYYWKTPTQVKGILSISTISDTTITNLRSEASGKQALLVSGTNIKTINGSSVLGSGDLVVTGSGAAWGDITGTIEDQTDLINLFGGKVDTSAISGTTNQIAYFSSSNVLDALTTATYPSLTELSYIKGATSAIQTQLDLKAPLASPTFTGTVSGITATMVGLGNVTNESKATMFTSPAFTGTPTGIGIPVYAQVTGSNATTTGQALTNITGLSVALTTNAVYEFEAVMTGSTTAVTTGTGYGVQYSVAGGAVEAFITASSTSTATKTLRISALNTSAQAFLTTSAQTGGILIKGRVTTGANAGNLTIQHLKVTSGTSTIFIGSFLKVTRIS